MSRLPRPASWKRPLSALTAALLLLELLLHPHGHGGWWNSVLGFDLLFGLAGCALIVVVSKRLGKWFLQVPDRAKKGEEP